MKKLFILTLLIFKSFAAISQVGIGTASPQAGFHVENGAVMFAAPLNGDIKDTITAIGSGRRLIWNPVNASFQVGTIDEESWTPRISGKNSFAAGLNAWAFGDQAVSAGKNSAALGNSAVAMGQRSVAVGNASVALGDGSQAGGTGAVAIGKSVFAGSFGEVSVGLFNTYELVNEPREWHKDDRIFVIGNGKSNEDRSNALVMLKSGFTGLGIESPTERLEVAGTAKATMMKAATGEFAEIRLGGSAKSFYEEQQVVANLYNGPNIYFAQYAIDLVRVGRQVTVTFPTSGINLDVNTHDIVFNAIPVSLRPAIDLTFPVSVQSGGVMQMGVIIIRKEGFIMFRPDEKGSRWGGPNSGFLATSVSFILK